MLWVNTFSGFFPSLLRSSVVCPNARAGGSVSTVASSSNITYAHKDRQFVTVASGLGGTLARRAIGGAVPPGGSLWTFTIPAE